MTQDARESLAALIVVSIIVAVTFLLPVILQDVRVPRWLPMAGFALNVAILAGAMIRRWRRSR